MNRGTAPRILLVGAVGALALAASHFFFQWVLVTDAFVRLIYR
jgi:hypothetical protein